MMPVEAPSVLDVFLGKVLVGHLTLFMADQTIFAFTEDYVNTAARPILSLSFKTRSGSIVRQVGPSRMKLPPFFSNLLPEGHLRDYLANRLQIHREREFLLLAELGNDLPGAIVVRSSTAKRPGWGENFIDSDSVDIELEQPFRFSLAGIQLKFSAVREATGGLTIPADGAGGQWILKLPSGVHKHVPENEFSMLELARSIGINVPETRLIDTSSIAGLPTDIPFSAQAEQTFAIKRFDRAPNGDRIHIEDFAQIFGLYPAQKYQGVSYTNLATVIWLEAGEDDLLEFIRRLVFNLAIGNADMHTKNWSLIYPDGVRARLAPAYDFVSTIVYSADNTLALKIAGHNRINIDAFERLADKAALPRTQVVKTAKESARLIKDVWAKHSTQLPLPREFVDRISTHMKQVALLQS